MKIVKEALASIVPPALFCSCDIQKRPEEIKLKIREKIVRIQIIEIQD